MDGKKKTEAAFLDMLGRHETTIYRVCRMFARDDNDYVSELYNEVVLRLWEEFGSHGLSRFRRESSEKTWVSQIAFNTISQYHRRYAPQRSSQIVIDMSLADALVSNEEDDGLSDFWACAKCLDAVDKQIVKNFFNGDSYCQIAEHMGMTETAVGTRMSRIVKKMKVMAHVVSVRGGEAEKQKE